MELELIKTYIEYHIDVSRRVWDLIDQITDEQFLADDAYSRGSIRNLMIHLVSTDRRWLAGLKNLEDVGHLKFEDYSTRAEVRQVFEQVGRDLSEYANSLSAEELDQNPNDVPNPRWAVILHIINHGTDHRSTVLQRLHELVVPTFDQDFIMWLWSRK
ncbi:hypothetical protein MASR2M66_17740 [Chloroflexota bacterium]